VLRVQSARGHICSSNGGKRVLTVMIEKVN
jgi:hypothetical protein